MFRQLFVSLIVVLKILRLKPFLEGVDTSKSLKFKQFCIKSNYQQELSKNNNSDELIAQR